MTDRLLTNGVVVVGGREVLRAQISSGIIRPRDDVWAGRARRAYGELINRQVLLESGIEADW